MKCSLNYMLFCSITVLFINIMFSLDKKLILFNKVFISFWLIIFKNCLLSFFKVSSFKKVKELILIVLCSVYEFIICFCKQK